MTNPFLPSTMSRADIGREEAVPTRGDVVSEDEYDAEEMEDSSEEEEGDGYAQFIDPDDEESDSEEEEVDEEDALRREIESIPYDKLLKARRAMSSSQLGGDVSETESIQAKRAMVKQQLREMGAKSRAKDTTKKQSLGTRETKSAPTIMSTRRPVSRMRHVVDPIPRAKSRDPRFDSLSAGPVNHDLHTKSYGFLSELYQNEIKQLREKHGKLKRAEMHHAGPRAKSQQALDIRQERDQVEQSLRRAESLQNERIRRERERSVKSEFKKENQRRVDAGLRPYFPKKAQFHEAVLRKQFESMSNGTGSSAALRKSMDRKRRKDAQKEKKSLDSALGGGARTDLASHRPGGARPHKRGRRG